MGGIQQAILHDGKTAKPKPCTVQVEGQRLKISGPTLGSDLSWTIKDLRLVDESWHDDETYQLKCSDENDARIELSDRRFLEALSERGANLKKDIRTVRPALIAAGVLAACLAGLWFGLPYAAKGLAKLAPRSWEEKLGETVADTAIKAFTVGDTVTRACIGEAGTSVLARLVNQIDQHDGSNYTYRLRVIDSDIVNAFAAPGGYLVIFSGIIDEFENGDELAAVLAHEIGHVTNQHSIEGIFKSVGVGAIAAMVTGDVTGSTIGLGIEHTLNAQNSQEAEHEADLDGITFLNDAGITSTGLGTFFQRMHDESEHDMFHGLEFLSSHPSSDLRSEYSKTISETARPAMTDEEWAAVQAMCNETEIIHTFEWPEWMKKLEEKLPFPTESYR